MFIEPVSTHKGHNSVPGRLGATSFIRRSADLFCLMPKKGGLPVTEHD